jgi:4-alpha-glucanotransferase
MEFLRSSGVLLHPTSLASNGGIGDLGPAAHDFVQFLAAARQHIWQVLPLSPTGYGNSPYAASSAFAGNPYLISLEYLVDWGWISHDQIARIAHLHNPATNVDFDQVQTGKVSLLHEAAANFLDRAPHDSNLTRQWAAFESFCSAEASWLIDYAYYAVLRTRFNTGAWTTWPEPLRRRRPEALAQFAHEHGRALAIEQVLQFAFAQQWNSLRQLADQNAIRILGDVAIFVNMDSADVWVHPELFELDADLHPIRVAGVPPDYFSATGQRWGNPLYRWDVLEADGFNWWIARIRRACALYDIVRLDHFRGFEAYWAIPAEEETAVKGEWVKAPGKDLFEALEAELGPLPLVAEDLGVITPQVEALRTSLGLPTMRVMQFGFSDKGAHPHLPHLYTPGTVAYTGTHDNDTTQGWWHTASKVERAAVQAYVGPVQDDAGQDRPVWPLIRALYASVAEMAIVPAQDLLELDSSARMNTPAVPSGNWSWRAQAGSFTPALAQRLAALVAVTDREYDPLGQSDPAEESNSGSSNSD